MADFVELTTGETAAKAFIRQALMRKVKDNFTNLNARMTQEEQFLRLFDHMNFDDGSGRSYQTLVNDETSPSAYGYGRSWIYIGDGGRQGRNAAKPSHSVARISVGASGDWGWAFSLLSFSFADAVKPIRWKARLKISNDGSLICGMREGPYNENAVSQNRPGIWLERFDSSSWRFACYDGTTKNNGTAFTRVTNGTWFEAEIEFTNSPSDRAICRIDGAERANLQANLPTTQRLLAIHGVRGPGGATDFDVDRVLFSADGLADAA
jgi:hypothetical protein